MIRLLPRIKRSTKILVLQSGFGTAARYIAEEHNCKVACLNDDKVQNAFNQEQIDAMDLTKKVTVAYGNVDYMPFEPNTFDFVIAQDSFSITARKRQMFRAIHRVMKPEGRLIFSAIMRSSKGTAAAEKKINSLPVEELITLEEYEADARRGFFQQIYTLGLSEFLGTHFEKLSQNLQENQAKLSEQSSEHFIKQRIKECDLFHELAVAGELDWGILMFQKLNG